jgi:glycosyltransferase involved in cell wall biosynthesis
MNVGMIRAKNEARWIFQVVRSIAPLCDEIFVLDDHSTDETAAISKRAGATVLPSPFSDFNESRDMQYLFERANAGKPEWVISIDGDEELHCDDVPIIWNAMYNATNVSFFKLRILYLWDRLDQRRVDGVYGDFRRKRIFRPEPGAHFRGGLHCGGAGHIQGLKGRIQNLEARLLHYGYLHKEDRLRKYKWHNEVTDPNNTAEDCYRHMIQGHTPETPAGVKLKHAGPLRFEAIQ